ncbi:hypothetical protein [Klebsiella oxytoca]|uniref:hypothetical protein n=1 Tax=Klebsiella oxytoca TaxID=571 RepID=UPI003AB09700
MSDLNPNRYILLVFGSERTKPLITLNSTTPFGSLAVGDSFQVNDLRPDDSRESLCRCTSEYAKIMHIEHRVSQAPFGEIEHLTKVFLDLSNNKFTD